MFVCRSFVIVGLALGWLGWSPEIAWADVEVRRGPNFLVLEGASGVEGCAPREIAKRTVRDRVLSANEVADVDPSFGVVLSLEVPPCTDLFYAAVSNDVRGIGYQHFYESEIFDESPGVALEGVAFLNDVPYWEFYPEELTRAFLHEVGHRWGVRVRVAGDDPTALLGRDLEHWSYFLDAASSQGVSPLEGNVWLGEEPSFVSGTDEAEGAFSDFDLYLMGLLPPEEVSPLRVLTPETGADLPTDCRGAAAGPGSPPQRCEAAELTARSTAYSIQDVIAEEGPREPPASTEPREATVAFYFSTTEGQWTNEECEYWSEEVDRLVLAFSEATGGRMTLSNVLDAGASCQELVRHLSESRVDESSPPPDEPKGCGIGPDRGAPGLPASRFVFWLMAAAALVRLCSWGARARGRR